MSEGQEIGSAPKRTKPGLRERLQKWGPSKGHVAVMAIGLLTVSNIAAWTRILQAPKAAPRVVTVAATEMTQNFIAREAVGARGPAEAQAAMQAYLAVSQDTVRRAAEQDGVLILARECVLGGEAEDWTKPVERAVASAMDKIKAAKPAGQAPDLLSGALMPALMPAAGPAQRAEGPRG